jgi:hypothetical protein
MVTAGRARLRSLLLRSAEAQLGDPVGSLPTARNRPFLRQAPFPAARLARDTESPHTLLWTSASTGDSILTIDARGVHDPSQDLTYPHNHTGERRCRGLRCGAGRGCAWRSFWQISRNRQELWIAGLG